MTMRAMGRPELAGLASQARRPSVRRQSRRSRAFGRRSARWRFHLTWEPRTSSPQGFGATMLSADWTFSDIGATRRRAAAIHQHERATLKQRREDAAGRHRPSGPDQVAGPPTAAPPSSCRSSFAIVQAEENIKVIIDRYRQQLSTYTEVLDAETRRIQSLSNYYNSLYDESLAFFRLRRAVGDI